MATAAPREPFKCKKMPLPADPFPHVAAELYGRAFRANRTDGRGTVVVLGCHNTGTSMITRLVMLLGAFQGNRPQLDVTPGNALKYWERPTVYGADAELLAMRTEAPWHHHHAVGVDLLDYKPADVQEWKCRAWNVIRDISRHKPAVVKDPRMGLVLPFWRPFVSDLVCLVVQRDPVEAAVNLARNWGKSQPQPAAHHTGLTYTAQQWLETWQKTMVNGLLGCAGRPTVVINSAGLTADVDGALATLLAALRAAGVRGLTMPAADEVEAQVKRHIKEGPHELRHAVDAAVPVMTPAQARLEDALQAHLFGKPSDPWLAASQILAHTFAPEALRLLT